MTKQELNLKKIAEIRLNYLPGTRNRQLQKLVMGAILWLRLP